MNLDAGSVLWPAGSEARADMLLAWALVIGSLLIFAAVMALLWRAAMGPPRAASLRRWLVGGGLVFPGLVLAVLAAFNLARVQQLFAATPSLPVISVHGRLWWWELREEDGTVHANQLVLPVGRRVRLSLASDDVIHSLWVPALAGKMDLVPGRVNHLVIEADRAGEWRAPCAEFCGEAHTTMALHVVALPPAEHAAWRERQRRPAREPADDLQREGRRLFVELRCGACHTVRGVVEQALPRGAGGPDLTHLAGRRWLGAGALRNDEAGLRAWITGVQQLKPGARMPSYPHLDAPTLDALVAWLASLE